ncbi:phage tail tip lysozyme [Streptomyces sp. NPDC048197]|uniref:phage tail tip lysozyme n=1 Tax=Streptomyces sp. NPDC048197 TaxID=3365511 RepID=UPI003719BD2E
MSDRLAYFFRADRYLRYNIDSDSVDVGPTEISRFWPALPEEFQSDLDATINWGDGHAYFFKDDRYLRYDIGSDSVDVGPTEISRFWPALPAEFQSDLDATINWGDGHAYFFKGDRYLRYNIKSDSVDVGPTEVSRFWPALPAEFQSKLDTIINWGDGHAYFFKDDRYLRYNIGSDSVDVGPTEISRFWPALPEEFQSDLDAIVNWSEVWSWEKFSLDQRLLYVMERLVDHYGYPVNGAAGLLGNLVAESGVIPPRVEGSAAETPMRSKNFAGVVVDHEADDIMNRNPAQNVGPALPGIGLAQWTSGGRRAGLFTHPFGGGGLGARAVFNMDAQIDYLDTELRNHFSGVRAVLMRSTVTVNDACDEVLYNFEVPGSILQGGTKLPRSDARVQQVFAQRRPSAQRAANVYRAAHP